MLWASADPIESAVLVQAVNRQHEVLAPRGSGCHVREQLPMVGLAGGVGEICAGRTPSPTTASTPSRSATPLVNPTSSAPTSPNGARPASASTPCPQS
jgi:hypothetical protein